MSSTQAGSHVVLDAVLVFLLLMIGMMTVHGLTEERSALYVCVCVCVCERARARVCVCVFLGMINESALEGGL